MNARTTLRLVLASALALAGCNALIDVKDIYLDADAGGPGAGDATTDGNTTDGNTTGDGSSASDGGSETGPCAANLQVDPKNCGRCGHDCAGGTCTAGMCGTVTLAAALAQPNALAIDDTNVYIANKGDGTVLRVPKAGGAADLLVSGQDGTTGLAVAGTTLFWSNDSGAGGVWRCALPACTDQRKIAPASYARHMDAKNGYVYYATESDVRSVLQDGGVDFMIATVNQAFAVAADATHVYYTSNQNDVYRNLVGGGGGLPVGPLPATIVGFIAVDDARFYWAYSEASGKGHVYGASKASPTTRVEYGSANTGSVGVASDGTAVYWSNDGTNTAGSPNGDGELLTCPTQGCGGGGPVRLADKLHFGGPIVTDGTTVYFIEHGGLGGASGTVRRVVKP